MWKWIERRLSITRNRAWVDPPPAERQTIAPPRKTGRVPSRYVALHTYLLNRYADVVVLTFGQIEDLLGFTLPESARTQGEWWTVAQTDAAPCSDAWILAGRTARPNLLARTVTFERALGS